jgi:hypothetical protein
MPVWRAGRDPAKDDTHGISSRDLKACRSGRLIHEGLLPASHLCWNELTLPLENAVQEGVQIRYACTPSTMAGGFPVTLSPCSSKEAFPSWSSETSLSTVRIGASAIGDCGTSPEMS